MKNTCRLLMTILKKSTPTSMRITQFLSFYYHLQRQQLGPLQAHCPFSGASRCSSFRMEGKSFVYLLPTKSTPLKTNDFLPSKIDATGRYAIFWKKMVPEIRRRIRSFSGRCTWRIIPVGIWLGSPPFISHEDRPFGRGRNPDP